VPVQPLHAPNQNQSGSPLPERNKERLTDVFVGSPRAVKKWLLAQPATMGEADVIAIGGAAMKPSTSSLKGGDA